MSWFACTQNARECSRSRTSVACPDAPRDRVRSPGILRAFSPRSHNSPPCCRRLSKKCSNGMYRGAVSTYVQRSETDCPAIIIILNINDFIMIVTVHLNRLALDGDGKHQFTGNVRDKCDAVRAIAPIIHIGH